MYGMYVYSYLPSNLSMHNIKIKEMEMLVSDLLNIMEGEQKKNRRMRYYYF